MLGNLERSENLLEKMPKNQFCEQRHLLELRQIGDIVAWQEPLLVWSCGPCFETSPCCVVWRTATSSADLLPTSPGAADRAESQRRCSRLPTTHTRVIIPTGRRAVRPSKRRRAGANGFARTRRYHKSSPAEPTQPPTAESECRLSVTTD